jgi:centromere protein C
MNAAIPLSFLQQDLRDNSLLRRSTRVRLPPLEFWKNERIVYGPDYINDSVVPVPVAVVVALESVLEESASVWMRP